MLTIEQRATLARIGANDGLFNSLRNEIRQDYLEAIANTETHESKKREDLFTRVIVLNDVFNTIRKNINIYNNSI